MIVGELNTGDRIRYGQFFGYILEALHCEHGMTRLTYQLEGQEQATTNAYLTDKKITSGLEVLGPDVIEEELRPEEIP